MQVDNKNISLFAALAALMALTACRQIEQDEPAARREIVFSVSTEPLTRTALAGGVDTENEGEYQESISWSAGDVFRVYSPQSSVSGGSAHDADYTLYDGDGISSDTPLQWEDAGSYDFYAFYPSPGSGSSMLTNGTTVSGSFPSVQTSPVNDFAWTDVDLSEHGYMYAVNKGCTPSGNVILQFKPLMTVFHIEVYSNDLWGGGYGGVDASNPLTSVKLISDNYLAGDFTADLNATVPYESISVADNANRSMELSRMITAAEAGNLDENQRYCLTFLALPLTHSQLKLEFTYESGLVRTLSLKKEGNWISVGPGESLYIYIDIVPEGDWEYHLGALQDVEMSHTGGSSQLSLTSDFQSYRSRGSESEPVPYELQFSTNGTDWSTTPPSWLSVTDPASGYDGSVGGETLSIVMDPQVGVPAPDLHAEALQSAPAKGTAAAPFDLSKVNPSVAPGAAGGWNNPSATQTTANTYVVHAPGYYSIPVVYGNLLKNGVAQTPVADNVVDHRDAHITSPYIGVQRSYNPAATDARLFWSDVEGTVAGTPGLVTNVTFHAGSDRTQDYITFEVPAATICQGNALIGLRVDDDNDGTAETPAWSWTIWVTDEDLSAVQTVSGHSFAPVNLGWCNTKWLDFAARACYVRAYQPDSGIASVSVLVEESEGRETNPRGNSLEYQWGRKDPMRTNIETGLKTYYRSEYCPTGLAVHNTLGVSVRYPCSIFPTAGEIDTWVYDGGEDNLWESMDNPGAKQICDPCPVGFHLPPFEAFSVFTASNFIWSTEDGVGGRKYGENLFFPAQSGSGSGDSARYWTHWSEDPYDFGEWSRALIISPTTLRVNALISHVQVVGIRPVLETNP